MLRSLNLALFLMTIVAGIFAQASSLEVEGQAKLGLLTGNYSGRDATGKFDSQGAVEIEGNIFSTPGMAYAVRSSVALDITTSRTRYFYAGLGQRFFFGTHGFESFTKEGGDSIRIHPKIRYNFGYDLGLAQVLVIPYGTILGAYATTADANLSVEARYSIARTMSISSTLGFGVGTGIATMNVTTTTVRALLGFVYTF